MRTRRLLLLCVFALATCATTSPKPGLAKVEHIVVIYAENRSFDHLYGMFPGADGVANATPAQYTQLDYDGKPLPYLPPVWKTGTSEVDPAFPRDLPNKPFRMDLPPVNVPLTARHRDLIHKFYPQQEQIDGGLNNRFAEVSDAGGLTMGYYDGSSLPMWKWAREYTLADHFFMGAFGDSYINHFWLVCACTPRDPNPPQNLVAQLDERGWLKRRATSPASALQGPAQFVAGEFTADGYSLSTNYPPYQPSRVPPAPGGDARYADASKGGVLPPQTQKTIGDTLSAKGISWAWYGGAYNAALKDGMQAAAAKRAVIYNNEPGAPYFVAHHQPFNYFARFAPGTKDREEHLKDYDDLVKAIDTGSLPAVAFYKPQGSFNEHPGNTDVMSGDQHIADLIARIKATPLWSSTVVIVTYDENGGFWDHVPPPKGDRWGPGTRIPAIIVSPFAKKGFVDHTSYDTTSIIKFITLRFGLEPLPGVRANAGDLTNTLEF
jgi:acid phosphatase